MGRLSLCQIFISAFLHSPIMFLVSEAYAVDDAWRSLEIRTEEPTASLMSPTTAVINPKPTCGERAELASLLFEKANGTRLTGVESNQLESLKNRIPYVGIPPKYMLVNETNSSGDVEHTLVYKDVHFLTRAKIEKLDVGGLKELIKSIEKKFPEEAGIDFFSLHMKRRAQERYDTIEAERGVSGLDFAEKQRIFATLVVKHYKGDPLSNLDSKRLEDLGKLLTLVYDPSSAKSVAVPDGYKSVTVCSELSDCKNVYVLKIVFEKVREEIMESTGDELERIIAGIDENTGNGFAITTRHSATETLDEQTLLKLKGEVDALDIQGIIDNLGICEDKAKERRAAGVLMDLRGAWLIEYIRSKVVELIRNYYNGLVTNPGDLRAMEVLLTTLGPDTVAIFRAKGKD